nr:MAG TPA: hypothetical protein [Caudoviricetes sp.]
MNQLLGFDTISMTNKLIVCFKAHQSLDGEVCYF